MKELNKILLAGVAGVLPLVLWANSGSLPVAPDPPLKRTGAAVDGGLDCTACHRGLAANEDTRGRFVIHAASYTAGVKQTLRVRLEHPEAKRWGFQLTARLAGDPSKTAGSFTPTPDVAVYCDDGSLRGVPGPCSAGTLEFANHTAPSTRAGTGGGTEWLVEWTPPATDVGDVIFYAAGNAADNSGTNTGDIIYTTSLRIAAAPACTFTATPRITAIVNAASGGREIAPNSLVAIYGDGFAPAGQRRLAAAADFVDGKYPTELACVAVEIAGQRVPVLAVLDNQINVQAPTLPDRGPVTARVILNSGRSNQSASAMVSGVPLQPHAPAFFTFGGGSIAARFATTGAVVADPAVVPGGRPARPGDIISLYGTGFGYTDPVYQAGEIVDAPTRLWTPYTVTVGGLTLAPEDVLYAGAAGQAISGVQQFNIRIPQATPEGNVPVVIRIGGAQTQNGATIPVVR